MAKVILRCDDGPDFQVEPEWKLSRADITCSRSGKLVGYAEVYRATPNLLVYILDKRKKVGENRQAFMFREGTPPADILLTTRGGPGVKEALRIAKMVDESVLQCPTKVVVE